VLQDDLPPELKGSYEPARNKHGVEGGRLQQIMQPY